jgi:hypothetical protein
MTESKVFLFTSADAIMKSEVDGSSRMSNGYDIMMQADGQREGGKSELPENEKILNEGTQNRC